ncbi:hypothetical protein Vi05172_g9598 [Venturia inaequalis]|nr:hypothetical protein Vi05172_g9598 [Venturia inaequalis]
MGKGIPQDSLAHLLAALLWSQTASPTIGQRDSGATESRDIFFYESTNTGIEGLEGPNNVLTAHSHTVWPISTAKLSISLQSTAPVAQW